MEFPRIPAILTLAALHACAGRPPLPDRSAPIAGTCVFPAVTPLPPERRPPLVELPRAAPGSCEANIDDEDPCPPNATEVEAQPTLERSRQAREMRHAGDLTGAVALMAVHEAEDAWFRPMLRYRALLLRELGRADEAELLQQRFLGSYGDGRTFAAPMCLRNRHEIGELMDARRYREISLTPHEFGRFTLRATSESGAAIELFLKLRRTRYDAIRNARVSVRRDGNGCLETTRDPNELLLRNGARDGSSARTAYLLFGPDERNAIVQGYACPRGEPPAAAEPERIAEGGVAYDRVAMRCPAVAETRAVYFRPLYAPDGPCPVVVRANPPPVNPARPES